jgi:hypothetical protein
MKPKVEVKPEIFQGLRERYLIHPNHPEAEVLSLIERTSGFGFGNGYLFPFPPGLKDEKT